MLHISWGKQAPLCLLPSARRLQQLNLVARNPEPTWRQWTRDKAFSPLLVVPTAFCLSALNGGGGGGQSVLPTVEGVPQPPFTRLTSDTERPFAAHWEKTHNTLPTQYTMPRHRWDPQTAPCQAPTQPQFRAHNSVYTHSQTSQTLTGLAAAQLQLKAKFALRCVLHADTTMTDMQKLLRHPPAHPLRGLA